MNSIKITRSEKSSSRKDNSTQSGSTATPTKCIQIEKRSTPKFVFARLPSITKTPQVNGKDSPSQNTLEFPITSPVKNIGVMPDSKPITNKFIRLPSSRVSRDVTVDQNSVRKTSIESTLLQNDRPITNCNGSRHIQLKNETISTCVNSSELKPTQKDNSQNSISENLEPNSCSLNVKSQQQVTVKRRKRNSEPGYEDLDINLSLEEAKVETPIKFDQFFKLHPEAIYEKPQARRDSFF